MKKRMASPLFPALPWLVKRQHLQLLGVVNKLFHNYLELLI